MNKFIVVGVGLLLVGCGHGAQRIDTSSQDGRVISMKQVSPVDFNEAADGAIQRMLSSRNFSNYIRKYDQETNGDMPLLMLGKIVNNTTHTIDMPLLTEKIAQALMESEMVQVTTAAAGEGQLRDDSSVQLRDLQYDANFDQSSVLQGGTLKSPNLTLSGAIIEQKVTQERTTELVYTFSLTLTDNRTGIAVWKGNQEIGRQEKASIFGM